MKFVIVIFGLLAQATLGFGQNADDQVVKKFLDGLTYVGKFPAANVQSPMPKHGTQAQALPEKFVPGIAYVFHLEKSHPRLTYTEVRKRLDALSLSVVRGPTSPQDLVYLYIGGPLWRFEVKQASGRGLVIANAADYQLYEPKAVFERWYDDDIIVEVKSN